MDSKLARVKLPIPSSLCKPEINAERTEEMPRTLEALKAGDSVKVRKFGRGIVKERRKDGMYVVEADGWGQCGSSTPKFYVVRDELEWCQPRPVIELSTAEKLERAKLSKDRGGVYFSDKNFESSLQEYSRGIDFLKRVDFAADIGSDDVKAQAISLLIPCYNNLAICHLRLKRFTDAFVAASSVITLCDTLEKKKEGSLVKCLQEHGVTLDCIFVRWLGKALYYAGKAKLNCHDYDESVTLLQRAIKISKEADEQEIKKLLINARRYAAKNHKQQKKMWSHAFKSTEVSDGSSPTKKGASSSTTPTKPVATSDDIISSTKGAENGVPSTSRRRKKTMEDCHSNSSKNGGSRGNVWPGFGQGKLVPLIVGTAALAVIGTVFLHVSRRSKSKV